MKVGENMRIPEPILAEDLYMVKRIGVNVALPEPRTRFEKLLYIFAGGTIERPTPKTIEECFLDYITGGESELPVPKSRLQRYMYNVANPLNKIPVEPPKYRFECYWFILATMNVTISSDNPVEFTSLEGFLIDYTIWGNTEQDLSEIEISNAFVDGYSIDAQTGKVISAQGNVAILNPVTLKNGTYYVDYSVNTEENVTCQYSVFDGDVLVENVINETSTPFSITLTDTYLVYFSLYPATKDIIESFTITTSDGQVCPSPDYQFDAKGVGDYSTNKYIISLLSTGQENSQSATNSIAIDEPLHAIDNYVDSVNYLSQKETRKIKKLIVDGTNVKFSDPSSGVYRYVLRIGLTENEAHTIKVWSNIALFSKEDYNRVSERNMFTARQANNLRIYIYFPKNYINIESPTSSQIINFFNNKAQELYNNGTPIIFYYVSSMTKEAATEIPEIPTYAPSTELTVDTEVQPSQIKVVAITE